MGFWAFKLRKRRSHRMLVALQLSMLRQTWLLWRPGR
jgi:hypothetical protein